MTHPDSKRKDLMKKQKNVWKHAPIVFAAFILLALVVGLVHDRLDQPRQEAQIIANVKSHGGEVVKIVHSPGRATPGYVVATFDGKQSHCILHLLDRNPPVFDCDPAISR